MIRTILIYVALIAFSIFTINANWLSFNGQTTIEIFNRLPVLLAPANFTYFIWFAFIAIAFVCIVAYQTDDRKPALFKSNLQIALFISVVLLHFFVILIWHNEQYMSAVILSGALLILLYSLYITYPLSSYAIKLRLPTAILFSWYLFLLFSMINVTLVHYEWGGIGVSESLWTVILLTILTIASLLLKYHYDDLASPIVFMWCFIGVAIHNIQKDLLVSTAAVFLCGVLLAGLYVLKKNREA